jgi:hypothetical protein
VVAARVATRAAHVRQMAARRLIPPPLVAAAAGYAMSGTEIRTTHVTYDRAGKLDVQCGEQQQQQHVPQVEIRLCCNVAAELTVSGRSVQGCMHTGVHVMGIRRNADSLTCRWHDGCTRSCSGHLSTAAAPSHPDPGASKHQVLQLTATMSLIPHHFRREGPQGAQDDTVGLRGLPA